MCDTRGFGLDRKQLHKQKSWLTSCPVQKCAALATTCLTQVETQVVWLACVASAQVQVAALRKDVLRTHQLQLIWCYSCSVTSLTKLTLTK